MPRCQRSAIARHAVQQIFAARRGEAVEACLRLHGTMARTPFYDAIYEPSEGVLRVVAGESEPDELEISFSLRENRWVQVVADGDPQPRVAWTRLEPLLPLALAHPVEALSARAAPFPRQCSTTPLCAEAGACLNLRATVHRAVIATLASGAVPEIARGTDVYAALLADDRALERLADGVDAYGGIARIDRRATLVDPNGIILCLRYRDGAEAWLHWGAGGFSSLSPLPPGDAT
jgi:hypothetical protein